MGKKYHDEDWLRQEYVDKGRTLKDIGDECDVTATTIGDWMDRHGIERRSQQDAQKPDEAYTTREWLHTEYVDKGRSMSDIGDECGVSAAVILKWLRRYGIETRSATNHLREEKVTIQTRGGEVGDIPGPYIVARSSFTQDGEREFDRVYIHQLLAIADGADPHKVFSNGEWHCHHKNGLRWDNRPSNIEFKTGEDHLREHSEERVRTPTGEWE